jgi:hypothetical protein
MNITGAALAFAQAWQAGLRMTPTEAVDYALNSTP